MRARDADVKLNHVALGTAGERELIEGKVVFGEVAAIRQDHVQLDVERGTTRGVHLARKGVRDGADHVVGAGAREKAKVPEGQAEDGNLRVAYDLGGAQQRAITTEGDHQVATLGSRKALGVELLVVRPSDDAALALEPLGDGL